MWSEERESMEGLVFFYFFIDPSGRWWMSNEGKKGGREDGLLEGQKLARVIKS